MAGSDIHKRLKRIEKDKEKARELNKPKKLVKMVEENGEASVRVAALYRLAELARKDDEKALEALRSLCSVAPRLADRCEASLKLPDAQDARQALAKTLRAAAGSAELNEACGYSQNYHPANWFACVRDDAELMTLLYDAGGNHVQSRVENAATDHDLLKRIIMGVKNTFALTLIDNLGQRFQGTKDDWVEIAQNGTPEAVIIAVGQLDLTRRGCLESLADSGNAAAKRRLLELSPGTYASRYPDSMNNSQLRQLLDAHKLDQAALEMLCAHHRPKQKGVSVFSGELMNEALRQLTEQGRLERVLHAQQTEVTKYVHDTDYEKWRAALLERLFTRQDLLADYLLDENVPNYYAARCAALEQLRDEEQLFRVASANCASALDAAKKLPSERYEALVSQARRQEVREYAEAQRRQNGLSSATEEELLNTLEWALREKGNKPLAVQAAKALHSQGAMLRALSIIGRGDLEFDMSRVTDGAGLAALLLEEPGRASARSAERLHELIVGTEAEQTFIDESVRRFRESGMGGSQMWVLSKYLGKGEMQTIWRYCGEDYVRKQIHDLEAVTEIDVALRIVNNLKLMYRNVPESSHALMHLNGKKYTKHSDFDAPCASESEHENRSFTVALEK